MASQHAGVLFDLDGTVLDTAPDMAAALNVLRVEEGLPPMPFHEVRPHVSHGSVRLIQVGFDDLEPVRFEELRRRFLDIYRDAIAVATRQYMRRQNIDVALKIRELRKAMERDWGLMTRWTNRALAPAVLWSVRRDARKYPHGKRLEPMTFFERRNWPEPA